MTTALTNAQPIVAANLTPLAQTPPVQPAASPIGVAAAGSTLTYTPMTQPRTPMPQPSTLADAKARMQAAIDSFVGVRNALRQEYQTINARVDRKNAAHASLLRPLHALNIYLTRNPTPMEATKALLKFLFTPLFLIKDLAKSTLAKCGVLRPAPAPVLPPIANPIPPQEVDAFVARIRGMTVSERIARTNFEDEYFVITDTPSFFGNLPYAPIDDEFRRMYTRAQDLLRRRARD